MSIRSRVSPMSLPTRSSVDVEDLSILVQELRGLGFDAIRFASYRTAAKLRFIQKKSQFVLLDLWNVIEGVRENGLNALEPYSILTAGKLESLVSSLYLNLNKRLPLGQQVDVSSCSRYLLSWLLIAYDNENSGRVRVFSVKVGLVTLCNGKLVDKLRYIFSQISDSNGLLVLPRFSEFLQEALALPTMVLESPTFGFTDGLAASIFDGTSKTSVNGFLEGLLQEPGPPCLMWLPLLHTMAAVEEVSHGVGCNVCRLGNIRGFRYKCQKCASFNMCQSCFWEGKSSESHRTDHEVKEYSSSKPLNRSFRNSFRKSFRCVPEKPRKMPRFPDQPEKPLNLSHIVPPSPLPVHNGFPQYNEQLDAYSDQKLFAFEMGHGGPNKLGSASYADSLSESDEEHRLIARYTARLASEMKYPPPGMFKTLQHSRTLSQTSMSFYDTAQSQRELIGVLEARNREIAREIAKLRAQQELEFLNAPEEPFEELEALRYHRSELEDKLNSLQDSRNHLMGQLEGLMRLLKTQQMTPKSTPTSSPRSAKSPPLSIYSGPITIHRSAPVTPHHHPQIDFGSFTSDLRSAFNNDFDYRYGSSEQVGGSGSNTGSRSLRNDLLLAADSVTNAMSSLVKELNSGSDEEGEGGIMKPLDFSPEEETNGGLKQLKYKTRPGLNGDSDGEVTRRGLNLNLSQPHFQNKLYGKSGMKNHMGNSFDPSKGPDIPRRMGDIGIVGGSEEFTNNKTDDEDSLLRSEDESGSTDWEDGLKRNVNHQ